MNWLVWMRGLRGPEPQLHHGSEKGPSLSKTEKKRRLAQHFLKEDERTASLNLLADLYPPPVQPEQ